MKTLLITSSRVQATISTVYTKNTCENKKTRGNKRVFVTLQIITSNGPIGASCFAKSKLAKKLVKRAFEKSWLMVNLDEKSGLAVRKNINAEAIQKPLTKLMSLI